MDIHTIFASTNQNIMKNRITTFNATARNHKKNQEITLVFQVEELGMPGHAYRYRASLVSSEVQVILGENPTGYYSDGSAVQAVDAKDQFTFEFGRGELKRQGTGAFVCYIKGEPLGKKSRFFFSFPGNEKGFYWEQNPEHCHATWQDVVISQD